MDAGVVADERQCLTGVGSEGVSTESRIGGIQSERSGRVSGIELVRDREDISGTSSKHFAMLATKHPADLAEQLGDELMGVRGQRHRIVRGLGGPDVIADLVRGDPVKLSWFA